MSAHTPAVKRYFMRATSIIERVGDEKCDCETPCQCVVYATDYDALLATTAKLRELLAAAASDTARLDAMEELVNNGCCPGIINDDAGRWAVTGDGMQNVPCNDNAIDINTTFFVEADKWRDSIREAIDDYLKDDEDEDEDDSLPTPSVQT
jgi:hypothetical protein